VVQFEVEGVALSAGNSVTLRVPATRQAELLGNGPIVLGQPCTFTIKINADGVPPASTVSGSAIVKSSHSSVTLPLSTTRKPNGTWDVTFTLPAEATSIIIELTADGQLCAPSPFHLHLVHFRSLASL